MTDVVAFRKQPRAPPTVRQIMIHMSEVNRHLGKTEDGLGIDPNTVSRYLTSLGCENFLLFLKLSNTHYILPIWRLHGSTSLLAS